MTSNEHAKWWAGYRLGLEHGRASVPLDDDGPTEVRAPWWLDEPPTVRLGERLPVPASQR